GDLRRSYDRPLLLVDVRRACGVDVGVDDRGIEGRAHVAEAVRLGGRARRRRHAADRVIEAAYDDRLLDCERGRGPVVVVVAVLECIEWIVGGLRFVAAAGGEDKGEAEEGSEQSRGNTHRGKSVGMNEWMDATAPGWTRAARDREIDRTASVDAGR